MNITDEMSATRNTSLVGDPNTRMTSYIDGNTISEAGMLVTLVLITTSALLATLALRLLVTPIL